MRDAPASLDPADSTQLDSVETRGLSRLLFDTFVTLDERGRPLPALASSWKAEPGNQRWQFNIRRGVTFQDGSALGADAAAASLRYANPDWKVVSAGEAVVIECGVPTANLPAILTLPRNAIVKRSGGKVTGSGPFAVSAWDPGKTISLTARDDYWGGRAFLDGIEIEMGVSLRQQMILLDLGKADLIEVAPEDARHLALDRRRIETSEPADLLALVFSQDGTTAGVENAKLRQALALSIDRESMNSVLLQGAGEAVGSLLPGWMTGYAFLFPAASDMRRAQLTRGEVPQAPAWTVAYDATDPLSRVIAERVALNASDAGLRLRAITSRGDLRLTRISLVSLDPQLALSNLAGHVGLPAPKFGDDPSNSLFLAESSLLQSQQVIPLLYLRNAVALSARVRGWTEGRDGGWRLADVWLTVDKPSAEKLTTEKP
jgi:ABC-type oligopeptide transport system substrate-binding subunit